MLTYVLIGVNVAVSLLGFAAMKSAQRDRFVFIPSRVARGRGIDGLVLSHFSHADTGHLMLNMLGLWFFGPVLEKALGPTQMVLVYVASGLIASTAIYVIRHRDLKFRALGASGSVAGVLFAAIVVYPQMNLYLLFIPIPIPGPIFAVLYVVLSTYFMGRQGSRICHEAHVGGALGGFALAAVLAPQGLAPLIQRVQSML